MRLLEPRPAEDEVRSFTARHFRPNLVVAGGEAWEEEGWAEFAVGGPSGPAFRLLKGCPRCTVPARAPATGGFHFRSKPLLAPQAALKRFWAHKCTDAEWGPEWEGPIFGIHVGLGSGGGVGAGQGAPAGVQAAAGAGAQVVKVGDPVTVLSRKPLHAAARARRLLEPWVAAAVVLLLAVIAAAFTAV